MAAELLPQCTWAAALGARLGGEGQVARVARNLARGDGGLDCEGGGARGGARGGAVVRAKVGHRQAGGAHVVHPQHDLQGAEVVEAGGSQRLTGALHLLDAGREGAQTAPWRTDTHRTSSQTTCVSTGLPATSWLHTLPLALNIWQPQWCGREECLLVTVNSVRGGVTMATSFSAP